MNTGPELIRSNIFLYQLTTKHKELQTSLEHQVTTLTSQLEAARSEVRELEICLNAKNTTSRLEKQALQDLHNQTVKVHVIRIRKKDLALLVISCHWTSIISKDCSNCVLTRNLEISWALIFCLLLRQFAWNKFIFLMPLQLNGNRHLVLLLSVHASIFASVRNPHDCNFSFATGWNLIKQYLALCLVVHECGNHSNIFWSKVFCFFFHLFCLYMYIYAPVNILPVRGGGGLTQGNLTS